MVHTYFGDTNITQNALVFMIKPMTGVKVILSSIPQHTEKLPKEDYICVW